MSMMLARILKWPLIFQKFGPTCSIGGLLGLAKGLIEVGLVGVVGDCIVD